MPMFSIGFGFAAFAFAAYSAAMDNSLCPRMRTISRAASAILYAAFSMPKASEDLKIYCWLAPLLLAGRSRAFYLRNKAHY
jgi:hypothetical protein